MFDVVHDPNGTAYLFARSEIVEISGKTGTAQVVKLTESKGKEVNKLHQDHALFVAFAPYENPEIAVAVIVEHGGHGSSTAAPKAKRVIEKYNELKELRNNKENL